MDTLAYKIGEKFHLNGITVRPILPPPKFLRDGKKVKFGRIAWFCYDAVHQNNQMHISYLFLNLKLEDNKKEDDLIDDDLIDDVSNVQIDDNQF